MKKLLSFVLALVAVFSLVSGAMDSAKAVDIEPRWNNTNSATVGLVVNSDGKATISLICTGKSGITTSITAYTKLERKWGLLWLDVDGGYWIDATTQRHLATTHYIQLSKKATYRVTTEYTVAGSGGANDVFTCTCQYTYE